MSLGTVLLIIVLVVVFGGGIGRWGQTTYGATYPWAGGGIGIGTVLIVLLVCYLLGLFR